jgi:hypothetical protein
MPKSRKTEFMKANVFLSRLKATVEALPSNEEKQAAQARITALADFLRNLQVAVDSMPTIESVDQVHEALEWLQRLFAKAEANPVLAGLAPASRAPGARKPKAALTEWDMTNAKGDIDALKALPVEGIHAKLLDEDGYSLTRVRAIAVALGIRATEKLSRESLAHQVTTKIVNYRGYEALSGKSESE